MTAFVDPQHIEVIIAKARNEVRRDTCKDCATCHRCGRCGPGKDDQCLAHLVLALLRPTVNAFEPPL